MVSIERCREILGEKGTRMSDEAVARLRERLTHFALLVFDMHKEQGRANSDGRDGQEISDGRLDNQEEV